MSWGVLDKVLEIKGFGIRCRRYMKTIFVSQFSFVVNREPKSWFKALRGLSRGDPPSPLSFTLVVDVL